MIKWIMLAMAFDAQALLVQGPGGSYDVQPLAGGGFAVYGLSGQGVTTVLPTGGGYTVLSPEGVTNVYEDGSTSNPNVVVNPFTLGADPVVPDLK